MTIHDFVYKIWTPPRQHERILSLTQVRDFVIIVTDAGSYKVEDSKYEGRDDFIVYSREKF